MLPTPMSFLSSKCSAFSASWGHGQSYASISHTLLTREEEQGGGGRLTNILDQLFLVSIIMELVHCLLNFTTVIQRVFFGGGGGGVYKFVLNDH